MVLVAEHALQASTGLSCSAWIGPGAESQMPTSLSSTTQSDSRNGTSHSSRYIIELAIDE